MNTENATAKRLLLFWLALVFFGVILLSIYWLNNGGDHSTSAPTAQSHAGPPPASHIRIAAQGQPPLNFERINGDWMMTTPIPAHANQARIRLLLNLRRQIASDATPEQITGNHADDIVITIDDQTWRLGAMTEDRQYRHISHNGKAYMVNNPWYGDSEIKPVDYLDPRLLPLGARITRLELPDLVLGKKPNGAWRADPPQQVSTGALAALVTNWQLAYASALSYEAHEVGGLPIVTVHYLSSAGQKHESIFYILKRAPRLRLYSPATRLSYLFPEDIAAGLLDLQRLNAEGEDALEPRIQ